MPNPLNFNNREPEVTHEVYALGHYEVMHLSMALQAIADAQNPDGSFSFNPELLADLDVRKVRSLIHIFNRGMITILRNLEGE